MSIELVFNMFLFNRTCHSYSDKLKEKGQKDKQRSIKHYTEN